MESKHVVNALGALAQETRLAIFRLLVEHGPIGLSAGRIADSLGLAPATLSFHLKELARAGLVAARSEGRFVYYRTDFAAMNALITYLTDNCCSASGVCELACKAPSQPRQTDGAAAVGKPTIHPKWRFA